MKNCNKLTIVKNQRVLNSSNQFKYTFEWKYDDKILIKESICLPADDYNLPIENYNIDELIEHKKHCCLEIEDIIVEEITI